MKTTGRILAGLLLGMAVFQIALAAGAPLAAFAWGGSGGTTFLPDRLRLGSALAALLLAGFAAIVLARVGVLRAPWPRALRVGLWLIVVQLGLNTLGNLASPSLPERAVMTPVTAVLFVLALVVARSR